MNDSVMRSVEPKASGTRYTENDFYAQQEDIVVSDRYFDIPGSHIHDPYRQQEDIIVPDHFSEPPKSHEYQACKYDVPPPTYPEAIDDQMLRYGSLNLNVSCANESSSQFLDLEGKTNADHFETPQLFVPPPTYQGPIDVQLPTQPRKPVRKVSWADMFHRQLSDVVEVEELKISNAPEVWIREEDPAVQAARDALFDQELAEATARWANQQPLTLAELSNL